MVAEAEAIGHGQEPSDAAGTRPALRIQLLGAFAVTFGTRLVTDDAWRLRKARSLVKLLALAPGHRLHREQVLDRLWPDLDAEPAANNLRKALHVARRALDPAGGAGPLLLLQDDLIVLAPPGPLWIDVEAFARAAAHAQQTRDPAAYRAALDLYGGDLLPEDQYEEWVLARREELRATYLRLLVDLARLHEARGEWEPAIDALQRATAHDPLHEPAHAGLMRLYTLSGQRPRALRQYRQLEERLRHDLDVEPSAESRRLYDDIAAGRLAAAPPAPVPSTPVPGRPDLPVPLTRFIGREREMAQVRHLLAGARLLTLTGAGGCGKTRLALEVARALRDAVPGGITWVDLAPLTDPGLVPQALAVALGVHEEPRQALTATLLDWLQRSELLLVFDNCEHLIGACAHLAELLLQGCPGLRILATSREALNIPGETAWVVPSLSVLHPADMAAVGGDPVAALMQSEGGRLFADRAATVQLGFQVTLESAEAVAQICARLDGIPLAIELAAARVRVMAVGQIAGRLDHSFRFLTAGSRTALPRHQTLSATIDWSYNLLSPPEQALFPRLAVLAGSFTLEAAEQIGAGGGIAEADVLDLLAHLVDKSLVRVLPTAAPVRYRILEMLRQYGHERLVESGAAEATARRHALYFLTLAAQAEPELRGPLQTAWLDRLDQEYDNLRAALAWGRKHDAEKGLRLAICLGQFWDARGYTSEGTRWLQDLLPQVPQPTVLRGQGLFWAGFLSSRQGDTDVPVALLEESLAIFRQTRDLLGVAAAQERLGLTLAMRSEYEHGRQLIEESVAGFRALGDKPGLGWALGSLGMLTRIEGRYDVVQALLEESQTYLREIGDLRNLAFVLNNLGQLARVVGQLDRARALLVESLDLARAAGDRHYVGWTLACVGDVIRRQGDFAQARAWLAEAFEVLSSIRSARHIAQALGVVAEMLAAEGAYTQAARLLGAAFMLQEHLPATLDADERDDLDAALAATRAALGEAAFARSWAAGQALSPEQAIACGLEPAAPE